MAEEAMVAVAEEATVVETATARHHRPAMVLHPAVAAMAVAVAVVTVAAVGAAASVDGT